MTDMVVDKIRFKREGCGFTYLRLCYNKGIMSPEFKIATENSSNYHIVQLKQDQAVKSVRVRVAEDKYVERVQFLNTSVDATQDVRLHDDRLLAEIKACNCGEDQVWDVPKDYSIVGIFGLTRSTKHAYDFKPMRDLNQIQGLGFIAMRILP